MNRISTMNDAYTKVLIDTFDELSETYTNNFTVDPEERVKIQSLVNLWKIKHGSNALEVGGGTGDLTPFLLEKICPIGKLSFLDISPKMVEKAKGRLCEYNNIDFIIGDIHTASFTYKFDTVVIFNSFPHFKDKKIAFSNCYKFLKKGGRLVISHNNSRWSTIGHHKIKAIENTISDFPEDIYVYETLRNIGYGIETFEDNEGYNYYLVIAKKA